MQQLFQVWNSAACSISCNQGVDQFHDSHVGALSTSRDALSTHVVSNKTDTEPLLEELTKLIIDKFNIRHITIQIEKENTNLHCDCLHHHAHEEHHHH